MVVTESTSMGMKKLWSISLVPSLVVPVWSKFAAAIWVPSVSYTHLTLPTICSV